MTANESRVRVLAEVVLVFLGILAAFALESWWDDRQQRAHELGALGEMAAEFAAAETEAETLLAGHQAQVAQFVELHRLFRSEEAQLYPDSVLDLTVQLWAIASYEPAMPAYENVVRTAGLGLVRSDSLRAALREYEIVASANQAYDAFRREYDVSVLTPTLSARLPIFSVLFGDDDYGEELRPAIIDLASDLEFRNLIGLRTVSENVLIQRRQALVDAIRSVRRLIVRELADGY